jgi:DNA polymerase III epsilon subunit-like protein
MGKITIHPGILFFDIETSVGAEKALNDKGAIVQIAAIATDYDFNPLETFEVKIKFRMDRADPKILRLIGYTDEKWKNAKPILEAAHLFLNFVSRYACVRVNRWDGPKQLAILAGHNIRRFDIPMILMWYANVSKFYNKEFFFPGSYSPSLDTLTMLDLYGLTRQEFFPSGRLTDLCKEFDIEVERHEGFSDTEASRQLAKILRLETRHLIIEQSDKNLYLTDEDYAQWKKIGIPA